MRVWYRMQHVDHVPNSGADDYSGTDDNPHAVPVVLTIQYTNGGAQSSPDFVPNSCTYNGISYGSTNLEPHHILSDAVSVVLANKYTNGDTKSSSDRGPHGLAYIRSNHHSHAGEIFHLITCAHHWTY